MGFSKICILFLILTVLNVVYSDNFDDNSLKLVPTEETPVQQGRTLVHNTVKRFMVILPAIFFKLGIAFTLLVLITLLAINNGFIGFLLLVVGLSSVLARLQDNGSSRRPLPAIVPAPYIAQVPAPYHHHHHQLLDRSDYVSDNNNHKNIGTTSYIDNNYSDNNQKYTSASLPLAYYTRYSNGQGK